MNCLYDIEQFCFKDCVYKECIRQKGLELTSETNQKEVIDYWKEELNKMKTEVITKHTTI
jgi:hypothetical protein